jgi:hypothetical protein
MPKAFYLVVMIGFVLLAAYLYWYVSSLGTAGARASRSLPPPRIALLSAACSGPMERVVCSGVVENISTESLPPLLAVVEWNSLEPDDRQPKHVSRVNAEPLAPGQTMTWMTSGALSGGARFHIRFKEAHTPPDEFMSLLHREGNMASVSQ